MQVYLKTPTLLRKWSIGSGKSEERDSSNAQIRTLLEEQRQKKNAEFYEKNDVAHSKWNFVKIGSSRTPSSSYRRWNAEFYEKNCGDSKWNFVTFDQQSLRNKNFGNRDGGSTKIPKFYLRYARKTKAHRGPEHYFLELLFRPKCLPTGFLF